MDKITYKKPWIPNSYYVPVKSALDLFTKTKQFNKAVDATYAFYTASPESDHYIPPDKLDRNKLAKHLLKYISNT